MPAKQIRIVEPCEFGDPGDVLSPEPWDVATMLVEIRRVAEYVETHATPSPPSTDRQTRRRKPAPSEQLTTDN